MTWDWNYVCEIMPILLVGVWYTLIVTIASSVIALVGGLLLAIIEDLSKTVGRTFVRALLEVIRGVPILVLLFFGYYVLPEFGIVLPAMTIGIVVLGTVYAAFCSEVYRGSLISIPNALREACVALSLSPFTTWWCVLVPLMIKRSAPALINYVLTIIRQTSFLFALGVPVLMGKASTLSFQSFKYLEPFTIAGLLYFVLNIPFLIILSRMKATNQ
jgi:polar amino acid transport system permease protein